jgi:hypothetical protein
MKHVEIFEDFPGGAFSSMVKYMVVTDEPIESNSFKPDLKLYTLCAESEAQALSFIAKTLGGSGEGPHMDRWETNEITTVLDMVKELNGMNGTWKLYEFTGTEAPLGMNEVKSIN